MQLLETYLRELRANRSFGTAETSHYGALANLLNAIGKDLKPRVKCVIHPQSKGSGIPDGGFFTAEQFQRTGEPLPGQLPVRGAMEVKPVSHNVKKLAESEQVGKYLETYGQILVTNYRDFITTNMTCDVYLNEVAYWRNVPERVWDYTIGGYQVMKKWLSYRERALLGRGLTPGETGEVREVTQMARRIAAILLLEPALDENYQRTKAATYDWHSN